MLKTTYKSLLSFATFSFGIIPNAFAATQDIPTLADIANTLISGTDFVTRLLLLAAVVLGAGFVIFSISTYRQHRMTPKLVPLDRPVLYFVLGVCLCALPFLGEIFGVRMHSTVELKKHRTQVLSNHYQKQTAAYEDPDAPLVFEGQ